MATGYIAKIEHGGRYISLDQDSQYRIMFGFRPPRIDMMAQYAQGSAASQAIGADVIGTSALITTIDIPFIIVGSSDEHIDRALNDLNSFLSEATEADGFVPTYFSWRSNNDIPFDPIYGQSNRRARIKGGHAEYGDDYGISDIRERAVRGCVLTLTIDSIEGYRQPVATATGTVYEDTIGTGNHGLLSRGVTIIPKAVVNSFDRVGGDGLLVYTPGGGVAGSVYANYNDAYSVWGLRGNRYTYTLSTTLNSCGFYRTISVPSDLNKQTFSFLARKTDGSEITSLDVLPYYTIGSLYRAMRYVPIGNGWYYIYYTIGTFGVTSVDIGLTLVTGRSISATMFAINITYDSPANSTAAIPPIHGDFPGCAWSGTAWASGFTTTPGSLYIGCSEFFPKHAGTIRFFYTPYTQGYNSHTQTLMDTTSSVLKLSLSDTTWSLSDAVGTITGSKTTTPGATYLIHIVWGQDVLRLYISGELIASRTSSRIASIPTRLYVGNNAIGASSTDTVTSTFSSLQIYDRPLTQAQVTLDYGNVSQIMAAGKAESLIPYVWTIDGDGYFDTNTSTGNSDAGFVAGIDGDISARTIWNWSQSDIWAGVIALGLWDTQQFVRPDHYGDWTNSTASVGTTPVSMAQIYSTDEYAEHLSGKLVYALIDCEDSGIYEGALMGRLYINGAYTPYFAVDTTGVYLVGPLSLPQYYTIENTSVTGAYVVDIRFYLKRTAGSAQNATCDDVRLIFDRFGYMSADGGILDGSYAPDNQYIGSPLDLTPGRYNHVAAWSVRGGLKSGGQKVTGTQLEYLYIVPRYLTM